MAALTLCFDDGFKDTYDSTRDLISCYGVRATYFVPTSYVGRSFYGLPLVSWNNLRECVKLGMEVGSHSVTHCEYPTSISNKFWRFVQNARTEDSPLAYTKYIATQILSKGDHITCPKEQAASEVRLSKEVIERELSPYRVTSFAYPRGSFDDEIASLVKKSGFLSARTTLVGLNYPNQMNLYTLKCRTWRSYTTLSMMNKWLDSAIEHDGWLIELFHHVSSDTKRWPNSCSIRQIRAHLEYAVGKEVLIDTQHNVSSQLKAAAARSV